MGKSRRKDTSAESSDRILIQKLKAVNRAQIKEIASLRKELGKREDLAGEYKELLDSTEQQIFNNPKPKNERCPNCSGEIEKVNIGKFTLLRCVDPKCDWRKRIETPSG